jgi:hypothetical protein
MPYIYVGVTKTWIPDEVEEDDPVVGPKPYRNTRGDFKVDNAGRPPVDPLIRWRNKYTIRRRTRCYEWNGQIDKYNRGTFFDGQRTRDAQKYAWFLEYGTYPEGTLKQTCSTPCCVNPAHLCLKVPRIRRKQAMFDYEDVIDIRRRFDSGDTVTDISKNYAASEKSVSLVARRKSYTWIEEK